MTEPDDYERHRSLLGVIPIAMSPMFDPFVQMLLDLGIEPVRLGSFAVTQLDPDADPRLRMLAISFTDEAEAYVFAHRVHGEAHQRPDVEAILAKVGPANCMRFKDAALLFWFGVVGTEITMQ